MDILESIDLNISDRLFDSSKVTLNAYNIKRKNLKDEIDDNIYNPKKYPDRAIDIRIQPSDQNDIHIFLNTKTKEWDSDVNGISKLSPMQMESFFKTNFYNKVFNRIKQDWPTSDPFYAKLIESITNKRLNIDPPSPIEEGGEFNKYNIDKQRSREKNAAGVQKRTNSGRMIVSFSDFGVEKKQQSMYYCWPKIDSEFKWSQWNIGEKVLDEEKANPMFVRMSFFHAGYEYGLNLSLRKDIDDNRGFFGYNLTLEPKIQWTTPIETDQMLKLSIVQHFLSVCKKRVKSYLDLPSEEIYKRIQNKKEITIDQIEQTKKIVKDNYKLLVEPQADKFIYT